MKYRLLSDENESFKTKIIAGGERGQLVEQSFKAGERGVGSWPGRAHVEDWAWHPTSWFISSPRREAAEAGMWVGWRELVEVLLLFLFSQ